MWKPDHLKSYLQKVQISNVSRFQMFPDFKWSDFRSQLYNAQDIGMRSISTMSHFCFFVITYLFEGVWYSIVRYSSPRCMSSIYQFNFKKTRQDCVPGFVLLVICSVHLPAIADVKCPDVSLQSFPTEPIILKFKQCQISNYVCTSSRGGLVQ